jgi:hypothetical protein
MILEHPKDEEWIQISIISHSSLFHCGHQSKSRDFCSNVRRTRICPHFNVFAAYPEPDQITVTFQDGDSNENYGLERHTRYS